VFRRSALLAQGFSRGYIDHAVDSGRWERVHRGIYIEADSLDIRSARLAAHLAACGVNAVVSHDSAAARHGFDSTKPRGETEFVTARHSCGVRSSADLVVSHARRTISSVQIDGVPVTTRAQTLLDIAARVDDVECERVLESALRGDNPKRPNLWRTEVLDELVELLKLFPRHPGTNRVRRVLLLRPPGCRPTGSFPETVLLQLLRQKGVEVIRQPTLLVIDSQGRRFQYYPDFLIVAGRCIVEIDGADHLRPQRSRTDAARQNRLIGFDVFRYPALTFLNDPEYAIAELLAHARQVRNQSTEWTESGRVVSGAGNEWNIVPASRRVA
jgi:very-short-patch-repair endonuclease